MRIEPEPGIGKMAAVAASERPKPHAALVRPDIRKDPGNDRSSALRACHPCRISKTRERALLACCLGEGLSSGRRSFHTDKLKPGGEQHR